MNYDIPVWWIALGVAVMAAAAVNAWASARTRLARLHLSSKAMGRAYVHVVPGLGGALSAGRAVQAAAWAPSAITASLAIAFAGAVALTVAPKYPHLLADQDVVHALNAPFYTGIASSFAFDLIVLWSLAGALRNGRIAERPEGHGPA